MSPKQTTLIPLLSTEKNGLLWKPSLEWTDPVAVILEMMDPVPKKEISIVAAFKKFPSK